MRCGDVAEGGRTAAVAVSVTAALLAAGCASGGTEPLDSLSPAVAPEGALPPIPTVSGPVSLHVEYPDSLQRIAARDSNFLFGSVGTGEATLIIDGHLVSVEPNGSFLAWLPVPRPESGDTAFYRLIARNGEEVDSLRHPFLVPERPFEATEPVWIDTASLPGGGEQWILPDEPLELAVRAAPGLRMWLEGGAGRASIADLSDPSGSGRYIATLRARDLVDAACRELEPCGVGPGPAPLPLVVVATDGVDTALAELPYALRLLDPLELPVAELREAPDPVNGSNGIVVGRPIAFGPYRWRFPVGTRAEVDGREDGRLRLRLAPGLNAWVSAEDATILPAGTARPRSRVGDLAVGAEGNRLVLRISLASPLPLHVEEPDDHTLVLTLYGAVGNTERIAYGAGHRLIESIRWEQDEGLRYRLALRLRQPVWGYRAAYESEGDDRASLRFEIHRPPAIDPRDPLRDRRIAIDPGHPGAGAYGPTGYYEGDANLAIGRLLAELLRAEGAAPILIRDDTLPLGLYHRTSIAEDAGAELFVSIHNNALPDGVRPFGREGTSTYYYHEHSRRLAVAVQDGMLRSMGLRDLGVYWGDLAVARMSWMPSVLTEGAFMMMPRHEAALRTREFQEAYARGVLQGIREFLKRRALGP